MVTNQVIAKYVKTKATRAETVSEKDIKKQKKIK
jgi:hypothetical protein